MSESPEDIEAALQFKARPWTVRICSLCGAVRSWVGDEHSVSIRFRMCSNCDRS